MRNRPRRALLLAIAIGVAGVVAPSPARSQTCVEEIYSTRTGATDLTPLVDTPEASPSAVTFRVASGAELCDAQAVDDTGTELTPVAGTPAGEVRFVAPAGRTIVFAQARARPAGAATTTSAPTTSTTSAPTTSTTTASTTSTTAAATTTTTAATTTTTTTIPGPRGPGNGPAPIRNEPVARSSPDATAVKGTERVDVVVRGTGDTVYWSFAAFPGPWSEYRDLGAPPVGLRDEPTIVSWGVGRLDVFARGGDDNLWQRFSENGGTSWSEWIKPVGDEGDLASAPDVSTRGPNVLDIWVLGTDNRIWQKVYDHRWIDGWYHHERPPVGIKGGNHPTATSWDSLRVDLLVRGEDDDLWRKVWVGDAWLEWEEVRPEGDLGSEPDVTSWEPGNVVVFILGTNGLIYALPYGSGGWGDWTYLVETKDTFRSGPGAASRGPGRFDVFARGNDDRVQHIFQ